jgi:hypothetical protein
MESVLQKQKCKPTTGLTLLCKRYAGLLMIMCKRISGQDKHQLLWCIDSFVLRNPPLRQAPKRYASCLGDRAYFNIF